MLKVVCQPEHQSLRDNVVRTFMKLQNEVIPICRFRKEPARTAFDDHERTGIQVEGSDSKDAEVQPTVLRVYIYNRAFIKVS